MNEPAIHEAKVHDHRVAVVLNWSCQVMAHELLLSKRQLGVIQAINEGNEEQLRAMIDKERRELYDELAAGAAQLAHTRAALAIAEAKLEKLSQIDPTDSAKATDPTDSVKAQTRNAEKAEQEGTQKEARKEFRKLEKLYNQLQEHSRALEEQTGEHQRQSKELRESNQMLEDQLTAKCNAQSAEQTVWEQRENELLDAQRKQTRAAEIASETEERANEHVGEARTQLCAEQESGKRERERFDKQETWYIEEIRALRAKIREIMGEKREKTKRANAGSVMVKGQANSGSGSDSDEEELKTEEWAPDDHADEVEEVGANADTEDRDKYEKDDEKEKHDEEEKDRKHSAKPLLQADKAGGSDKEGSGSKVLESQGQSDYEQWFRLVKAGAILGSAVSRLLSCDLIRQASLKQWMWNFALSQLKAAEGDKHAEQNALAAADKHALMTATFVFAIMAANAWGMKSTAVNTFKYKCLKETSIEVNRHARCTLMTLILRNQDTTKHHLIIANFHRNMCHEKLARKRLAYLRTHAPQLYTLVTNAHQPKSSLPFCCDCV